jgi:integrase
MAWIVQVAPSPRHPKSRWQVRYQDGSRERSAGIHHSPKAAEAARKRIERGLLPTLDEVAVDPVAATKAQTLFGDYVSRVWWPTWRGQHPDSAYQIGKRLEKRILPAFGNTPLVDLDADWIGAWKAALMTDGLKPATVNTYLALLGTILNTAVDSDYLPHSPLLRKSRAGRVGAAKNLGVARHEVWITRQQLDTLAAAITPRYRSLILVAALTGMRWGELAALRWDDLRLDKPLDDGAVAGPGRLQVVRPGSCDPSRCGRDRRIKGPNTPGGPRGSSGPLAANNFGPIWRRARTEADLDGGWPEHGGLRFHDLRHTHATWLLALRVPMIAVSNRLGHANPVVTMMVYAHVDKQVERGLLTAEDLRLTRTAGEEGEDRSA